LNKLIAEAGLQGEIKDTSTLDKLVGKGEISFEITGKIGTQNVTDTYSFKFVK